MSQAGSRAAHGERSFDVVLLGATGFAGGHAAARLAAAAPDGLRWAVAGRDPGRLAEVAARHGCGQLEAEIANAESVGRMARSTRVLLSTAGPYARLGDPVVDACVEARTHYADLAGEVPWMRGVIDRHHGVALANGTTLIPASGFDSVPADVAVFVAMKEAEKRGLVLDSMRTTYRLRGGLNGGTLASVLGILRHGDRRLLHDPYSLAPDATPTAAEREVLKDPAWPTFDETVGRHVAPFFMAPINRRVVRRSLELLSTGNSPAVPDALAKTLGKGFRYDEYQSVSKGRGWFAARLSTLTLGAGAALLCTRPGRALAQRMGPTPGEGPSDQVLESGLTRMTTTVYGRSAATRAPESFAIRQEMGGDPGNLATVRMLVEVGLALSAGEAAGGGVLTPMAALGQGLVDRLRSTGSHSIDVS